MVRNITQVDTTLRGIYVELEREYLPMTIAFFLPMARLQNFESSSASCNWGPKFAKASKHPSTLLRLPGPRELGCMVECIITFEGHLMSDGMDAGTDRHFLIPLRHVTRE